MKKRMIKFFLVFTVMTFILAGTVFAGVGLELEQSHSLSLTIPLLTELSLSTDSVVLEYNDNEELFDSNTITVTYRCNARNWALQVSAEDFNSTDNSPAESVPIPATGNLAAVVEGNTYYFAEDGITIASNEDTGTTEKTVNVSYQLELAGDVNYYAEDEYETEVKYTLFVFE